MITSKLCLWSREHLKKFLKIAVFTSNSAVPENGLFCQIWIKQLFGLLCDQIYENRLDSDKIFWRIQATCNKIYDWILDINLGFCSTMTPLNLRLYGHPALYYYYINYESDRCLILIIATTLWTEFRQHQMLIFGCRKNGLTLLFWHGSYIVMRREIISFKDTNRKIRKTEFICIYGSKNGSSSCAFY